MGIDFDSVEIILNSTGERNVIEKMVTDLVSQMEEEKLIDNSIREYYVYALVSWVESFLTVGTIIVISMAVRKFFPICFFDFFPYIETKNRRLSLKQILSVLFSHHNFLFTYIVGRYRLGKSYSNTVWRIGVIGNFY